MHYFVKDKSNLLDYNLWSGTDYLKNITGFTKHPTSSTEWSVNGERSLKLTRTSDQYNDYTTEWFQSIPTGNYLVTLKLYAPNTNGQASLFVGANESIHVGYSKSNTVQNISISVTDNNIIGMRISVYSSLESVYLDDLSVISQ